MWRRAFVATTVALGGTVEDALAALEEEAMTMRVPIAPEDAHDEDELVAGLNAKTRAERAVTLAAAIREVLLAADELAIG